MKPDSINITQIIKKTTLKHYSDDFAIFWIKNEVEGIEIDHVLYANISNSIFFSILNINGRY
jgi:AraC family transcriptional regulator, transcriptional activator of pobA